MVSPISAVTQGFISDGSHRPLIVSVQGLLIFALVGNNTGGGFGDYEEIIGGGHHRRKAAARHEDILKEDEELLGIIKAWLQTR